MLIRNSYTRSENAAPRGGSSSNSNSNNNNNHNKRARPAVLETRHDSSDEYTKTVRASEEGTYEVVAIKDRYCAFSLAARGKEKGKGMGWGGRLLRQ